MRAVAFLYVLTQAPEDRPWTQSNLATALVFFFVFLALDIWSISHGGW